MESRSVGAWAAGVVVGMCVLAGCRGREDVDIASVTCAELFQAETREQSSELMRLVVDEIAPTVEVTGYSNAQVREAVARSLRLNCRNGHARELAVTEGVRETALSLLSLTVSDGG